MYRARSIRVLARGRAILDGADIELSRGKVTALVGPNGAGKSTLLKVLAGELAAHSGEVTLDNVPLTSFPPAQLARQRAVLPQSAHVAFPFTVAEIVALGLPARLPKTQVEALVARALMAVDLPDFGHRILNQLSGGEQQRAQFARVLAQTYAGEGCYLLLDEPTASLDLSHQLLALKLARAHAEAGGGALMVLHDLNLAVMAADEIVALKDGKVAARGEPEVVLTDTLIETLYGIPARVRGVPNGPFILPQMMNSGA
jgi:iron complex transport system ATP-binding protein